MQVTIEIPESVLEAALDVFATPDDRTLEAVTTGVTKVVASLVARRAASRAAEETGELFGVDLTAPR